MFKKISPNSFVLHSSECGNMFRFHCIIPSELNGFLTTILVP
jgi:hypothetical protein